MSSLKSKSRLSKRSSYLLRHGAVREGLKIDNEGCVLLKEFLKHDSIRQLGASQRDILEMVETDAKQRYSIVTKNNGQTYIKANQGHSISEINETGMKEITLDNVDEYTEVVHGTFKDRLSSIIKNGLSKMDRNHIHFAIGLPGDNKVVSGARQNANIFIFVDIKQAMEDGMKFFISENKVILTKGIDGVLSSKYFKKILDKDGSFVDVSLISKDEHNHYDFLVVLDFEATCDETDPKWVNEIIEWPSVLIDCQKREIIDQIQIYVKPRVRPNLTQFCVELTGIQQTTIDRGVDVYDAMKQYNKWLASHKLLPKNDNVKWTFVTCGDWDLQTMLPSQMKMITHQSGKHFNHWINIKKNFEQFYKNKAISMVNMLKMLGMQLEGRHHSGLDDSFNTARIAIRMMNDGYVFIE